MTFQDARGMPIREDDERSILLAILFELRMMREFFQARLATVPTPREDE